MSSWAEKRARRMLVPWDEDTPDSRGFWCYVRDHYERCIEKSWVIAKDHGSSEKEIRLIANIILDKLASPLVYLWDSWCVLSTDKKAKYNPELEKIHAESVKKVEEAWEKAKEASS